MHVDAVYHADGVYQTPRHARLVHPRRMDTPLADGKGLREFYNRGMNAYGPRGPFRMILL